MFNGRTLRILSLGMGLWALSVSARGHLNKTAAIDEFCREIRQQFVETAPRYFSGPNPWVELERLPDEYPDVALASVYSDGSRVSWVVLTMAGPTNAWFETTNYFFNEAGLIRKRERVFEQPGANVLVKETTYFDKRKVLKATYHHSPLNGGKENWDSLYDPNAPDYTSTADLPVSFLVEELKQLTDTLGEDKAAAGLRTGCTSRILLTLLKFSHLVISRSWSSGLIQAHA